jgi:hypothetical protein
VEAVLSKLPILGIAAIVELVAFAALAWRPVITHVHPSAPNLFAQAIVARVVTGAGCCVTRPTGKGCAGYAVEAPVGLGEPATSVVGPVIGNAILVTSMRLRDLSIRPRDVVAALKADD